MIDSLRSFICALVDCDDLESMYTEPNEWQLKAPEVSKRSLVILMPPSPNVPSALFAAIQSVPRTPELMPVKPVAVHFAMSMDFAAPPLVKVRVTTTSPI